MVNEVAGHLRQYKDNLSSSLQACVLAVEILSEKSKNLFEKLNRSYSPPVQTSVSATRRKPASAQETQYTPQGTLLFYLHDHGNDMRRWDGKTTSALKAWVHELQGKTTTNAESPRKIAAPVYSWKLPRQSRRADFTSIPRGGTSDWFLQDMSTKDRVTHTCNTNSFPDNNYYGQN